jgi:N-acetylglucosaminyldiphosphoundecaprenol N-acetyl-beta-D-mannosaminyltransferase
MVTTEAIDWTNLEPDSGNIYTFLNPVSYLDALKNKNLFAQMDGIYADGYLLVSAIRFFYGIKIERYSFDMTSIAPVLFEFARNNGKTVYIVASKQNQVEKAVKIIKDMYRGITIIGFRNGYFSTEQEQDEEARHITKVNPDFLIVGMGAIMQEKFLLKVKQTGFKGIGFTCGGFIHQTSKDEIEYYPAWVDKYNVRFLYRMYMEPHTRKRYMRAGLLFPVLFIKEKLFG